LTNASQCHRRIIDAPEAEELKAAAAAALSVTDAAPSSEQEEEDSADDKDEIRRTGEPTIDNEEL